jgi:DNA polymerase I
MQGSLYIVDAYNYLYRAFFALPPLTTRTGQPTGAIHGLCSMLLKIEREHSPSHLVAVFDSPGATFRDALYPAYKSNRPPMPPDLAAQINLVPKVIGAFGISSLRAPGVEADDLIATLTRKASATDLQVVICSSDKDLMQLIGPGISMLDAMKNRLIGPSGVQEKWGVPPERVGDLLALVGDAVDNVPGVPGIGPKTAAALIAEFGSLDGLLARVSEVKGKRGEALREHVEQVKLARTLVALKEDVDLGCDIESLQRRPPDRGALELLFTEMEFHRMMGQVETAIPVAPKAVPPADDNALPLFSLRQMAVASVPVDPEPVVPPAPPSRPAVDLSVGTTTVIRDTNSLALLATDIKRSAGVGLSLLADGVDPLRAAPLGFGFALPDGRRFYVPVSAEQQVSLLSSGEADLDLKVFLQTFSAVFADPAIAKHTHGGKFVEVLLGAAGAALEGVVSDSLLAAYLIDPARNQHELADVARAEGFDNVRMRSEVAPDAMSTALGIEAAATLALAVPQNETLQALSMQSLYRDVELPLSRVLAAMERRGVLVDTQFLRALSQEAAGAIAELETTIHEMSGSVFNIGSPKQLATVLFEKLGLPVIRKTKTGASTDADVLEALAASHPVPSKILEYRSLMKLKGTYLDALPGLVNPRTGRLHTTYNQAVAATGRLSSSDPNLQNIPIRTPMGRRIREAFVAPPGRVLLSADYSQIELRVLAHFSGDPSFLAAFAEDTDIHRRTAAEIFGIPTEQVDADQRRIAKAINFGLVFGQTDFGLSQALHIPRAQAREYIERYFARYAGVKSYMDELIAEAKKTGEVSTLLGRRRKVPELAAARAQMRAHGERIARNTPIQGSAADILKLAMLKIAERLKAHPGCDLLLTVHDELVLEVPEGQAEIIAALVKSEMEGAYALKVPLRVDVGFGRNWGVAH